MSLDIEAVVFLGYKIPKEIAEKAEANVSILNKDYMFLYMGYVDSLDIQYFGKVIRYIEYGEEAIEFDSILCKQQDFDEVIEAFNNVFKGIEFKEEPKLKKYLFCRYS